jgi:hypothetical protein
VIPATLVRMSFLSRTFSTLWVKRLTTRPGAPSGNVLVCNKLCVGAICINFHVRLNWFHRLNALRNPLIVAFRGGTQFFNSDIWVLFDERVVMDVVEKRVLNQI